MRNTRNLFVPGAFYHVYNRGVAKMAIFKNNNHYRRFYELTGELLTKYHLQTFSFNLQPNHFHFGMWQSPMGRSISKFVQTLSSSYSLYFNKNTNRVGHLFQGRFKSKRIEDDRYLLGLTAYIHNNSVEHFYKMYPNIRNPQAALAYSREYRWSSYRHYLSGKTPAWLNTSIALSYFSGRDSIKKYQQFVEGQSLKKLRRQFSL